MEDYVIFISLIESALSRIRPEYFRTQYDQFYALKPRLKYYGTFNGQQFIRHSERGFAYELYFQLRLLIREQRSIHDFFPNYFLQGEIKKMDVHEVLEIFNYQSLQGGLIPDLLFHIPSQDGNAFVIEIKAQPELDANEILYDLEKLSRFLRRFNYRKAIFIAVNIMRDNIIEVIVNNKALIIEMFTDERLSDCNVIMKTYPEDEHLFTSTLSEILG